MQMNKKEEKGKGVAQMNKVTDTEKELQEVLPKKDL
jgi:hypothetical protein